MTHPSHPEYNPGYDICEALGMTRGTIACQKCTRKVIPPGRGNKKAIVCQHCGYPFMVIRLSWEGKERKFYYSKSGDPLTFAAALSALADINGHIREKTFDPADWDKTAILSRKFETAWSAFYEQKERLEIEGKRSPATIKNFRIYREHYFISLEGLDVREVRLKHLQKFYDTLPRTLSEKYKKNITDVLKSFFRWLKRWGEIDELPIWPEMGEVVEKEGFALQVDEQRGALQRIPAEHRAIVEFLMETGLRPGEACALMEIDINYRTRYAIIRRTWTQGRLRERTKEKRQKYKPLSDRACELIEKNQGRSQFIFTNPQTRKGYRPEYVRRIWKRYAGINVRLYDGTRHSWFSQMVEAGATVQELQKAGGHADARTLERYFHPSASRQHDLVNRRGNVIPLKDGKDNTRG